MVKRASLRAAPRVVESKALKGKLVRIGNSRGVRLPKAVIEQAGLTTDVEIAVRDNRVVISSATNDNPRAGWDEAFAKAFALHGRAEPEENWEDWQNLPNEFDEKEWTW
jgi:antitoxin MazE